MKSTSWWPFPRRNRRLVILDDYFPNRATGFRVAEYNALLELVPDLVLLSANPDFAACHAEYGAHYPEFANRIARFEGAIPSRCGFVYMNFLNNAILFLDLLEAHRVPFLVTLYPGGGFGLDEKTSDAKLHRVLRSPLLRGVITTLPIIHRYVESRLPPGTMIKHIPGVVVNPLYFGDACAASRPYFGDGKETLDVCFVAEKYMPSGVNKGYPEYLAAAHLLTGIDRRLRWHVIGNFSPADGDVQALGDRIRFWGRLPTAQLRDALRGMDAIVSPNQPFKLHAGNLDGFPTGCCVEASLCGVAMVVSDVLEQNPGYVDGRDILLTAPAPDAIAAQIAGLLADSARVATVGKCGQQVTRRLYAPELQIGNRHALLKQLAEREGCRL